MAEFAWAVRNQVRPLGWQRLGGPCHGGQPEWDFPVGDAVDRPRSTASGSTVTPRASPSPRVPRLGMPAAAGGAGAVAVRVFSWRAPCRSTAPALCACARRTRLAGGRRRWRVDARRAPQRIARGVAAGAPLRRKDPDLPPPVTASFAGFARAGTAVKGDAERRCRAARRRDSAGSFTEVDPSASVPDWSREHKSFWSWMPSRSLLASIRAYQRISGSRRPWHALRRRWLVLTHRFWSVVTGADIPLRSRHRLRPPPAHGVVIHSDVEIGPNRPTSSR